MKAALCQDQHRIESGQSQPARLVNAPSIRKFFGPCMRHMLLPNINESA